MDCGGGGGWRSIRSVLVLVVVVAVAGLVLAGVGATPAAADQHEPENAPAFNNSNPKVSFEIALPDATDHYPGDHPVHADANGYNASIEYAAAGQEAFDDFDAENGVWMDFIDIGAEWIDYSQCDATRNTKVFGIDRGNDNEGTQADEDLIEHRRGSELSAGGLTITFFDWGDLSGDPPYLAPEDAIVAAQGAGSNDGPCLKMTSDPGWYQVRAYANGTIATTCTEEGNSECEPDTKRWRGVILYSNYVYICECDSEQEARETLGPPPNERNGGDGSGADGGGSDGDGGDGSEAGGTDPSPTPTRKAASSTPTDRPAGSGTPTEAAPSTPTPTPASTGANGGDQQTGDDEQRGGGSQQRAASEGTAQRDGAPDAGIDRGTPTIADAPGFTPIASLVALLAASLLVHRRD